MILVRKVLAVFQPHLFSRKPGILLDEFCAELVYFHSFAVVGYISCQEKTLLKGLTLNGVGEKNQPMFPREKI